MTRAVSTYADRLRRLRCLVAIPTYNNAGSILRVIDDVRRYASDILVIDDGSTDRTAELLSRADGIRTIGYAKNRGKGYALRLALRTAAEEGYRYLLTLDADGQHFADDIPRFVERIEEAPDTLLVGARNLSADNMPSKNSFANRFSNFWFRVETGIRMADTQSGFRLYPVTALSSIRPLTSRYEFEVEILVCAAWRGIPVENIPIRVYYPPAGERVSHFRPFRDFARISLLNTFLVIVALLAYYPRRFVRSLNRTDIRRFIRRHITHSGESPLRLSASIGWGVACGIVPLWGYQLVFALATAHLLRLNKALAALFSNVSIPPMIPLILYASLALGARVTGSRIDIALSEISFRTLGEVLGQYLIGSLLLAALCGTGAWLVGWLLLTTLKHMRKDE